MATGINFGRWLERLGFKDGRQPDLIRAVQPVQVVSDVSYLVSPVLPPSGLLGAQRGAAGAGTYAALEIFGGTRGGTVVEVGFDLNSGSNITRIRNQATAWTMANIIAHVPIVWQGGETAAFRIGTVTSIGPGTEPAFRTSSNGGVMKQIYVPPGQFTLVSAAVANVTYQIYCMYQEYEAAPGAQ